jgi:hypothetical protein
MDEGITSPKSTGEIAPFGGMKESGIGPSFSLTGARKTASKNFSKSSTRA